MNIEELKLIHRAWRYRLQADKGGIRFMMDHLHKGNTAFDVGAHKGGYTYWMKKKVGPHGNVIAFEPQQKGALLLKKLFHNAVKVEQLAISDTTGIKELFIQPQQYDISFEASLSNKYNNAIKETVTSVTLDDYCGKLNLKPKFIKIDVEGHENQVISGATNTLLQIKPVLLIECEARHIGKESMMSIFKKLESFNYEGVFFFDDKILPIDQFNAGLHQDVSLITQYRYANNFGFVNKSAGHAL